MTRSEFMVAMDLMQWIMALLLWTHPVQLFFGQVRKLPGRWRSAAFLAFSLVASTPLWIMLIGLATGWMPPGFN